MSRRTAERIAVIAAILKTAGDERGVAATLVTLARKIALGQHVATFEIEAAPNALRDELEGVIRYRRFVKGRGSRRVRGYALGERVVILAPTHAGERGHVTCTTAADNVPLLVQLDGGGVPVPFLAHELEKERCRYCDCQYPRVDVVAKPLTFPIGQRVRWGDRLGTVQSDSDGVIAVLFDYAWPGEREGSAVPCHRSELELAPGTAQIAEVQS